MKKEEDTEFTLEFSWYTMKGKLTKSITDNENGTNNLQDYLSLHRVLGFGWFGLLLIEKRNFVDKKIGFLVSTIPVSLWVSEF